MWLGTVAKGPHSGNDSLETKRSRSSCRMNPRFQTRFAGIRPRSAVIVLGLTAAALVGCLVIACTAEVTVKGETSKAILDGTAFKYSFSDWHFFSDVVSGVRQGEWYYDAYDRLFPKYDYTPFSVFNYRTPVSAWVL